MKTEYFILKDGTLEVEDDKLIIHDKANMLRYTQILLAVCWLIISILRILKSYEEKDNSDISFHVIIVLVLIFTLVYRILRDNNDSVIPLNNISKIELKKSWFGKSRTGRIVLLNKKVRTFTIDDQEIVNDDLVEKLKSKNLPVID